MNRLAKASLALTALLSLSALAQPAAAHDSCDFMGDLLQLVNQSTRQLDEARTKPDWIEEAPTSAPAAAPSAACPSGGIGRVACEAGLITLEEAQAMDRMYDHGPLSPPVAHRP